METLTVDEAVETLQPFSQLTQMSAPRRGGGVAQVTVDRGLELEIGEQRYRMSNEALEQLVKHVPGMSKGVITQWPDELLQNTFNWFLSHQSGELRVLLSGERVLAFPSKDIAVRPPHRVLEHAVETLTEVSGIDSDDMRVSKLYPSLDVTSFSVLMPDVNTEPKAGDITRAGVYVRLSPNGSSVQEIAPYMDRLICTNGMVSPVQLVRWRGNASDPTMLDEWITQSVTSSFGAIEDEFEKLNALVDQPVNGQLEHVMRDLFNRHRVPTAAREQVLHTLADEADGTMYGVAQAFNRAANSLDDIDQVRNLWVTAGEISHQTDRCDACFRALN